MSKSSIVSHTTTASANNLLENDNCPPVVLIVSPDQIRGERFVAALMQKFIPLSSNQQSAIKKLSARNLTSNDLKILQQELASLSLFSPIKSALVTQIQELSTGLNKELCNLANEMPGDAYLFLTCGEIKKTDPIYKLCRSKKCLVEIPALSGQNLHQWVERELQHAGIKQYPKAAVTAIIELGANSPDQIVRLVNHLALFSENQSLSTEDIFDVFITASNPNEFRLIDALANGKPLQAQAELSQLIAGGKSPFLFLALVYKTFSNYLTIRTLAENGQKMPLIRDRLKLPPWLFDKQAAAANKYKLYQLKACLSAIVGADSKLKNRSLGDEFVLIELLQKLAPTH